MEYKPLSKCEWDELRMMRETTDWFGSREEDLIQRALECSRTGWSKLEARAWKVRHNEQG